MAFFNKKRKTSAGIVASEAKQLEFDFDKVEEELIELRATERELKMRSKKLHDLIKKEMSSKGISEYDGSMVRVVKVEESVQSFFDLSEFRIKHPKMYEEFLKTRIQKGYIKVSVL